MLEPKASHLRALSERFAAYVVCVGHYSESSPGFFLSKLVIERLANLGLSLDCDLYCDCGESNSP